MNQPLAFAQLLRLPNVFTAFADIGLAALAAGYLLESPHVFVVLLLASGCLYCAGMVLNDFFDREEDTQARAFRPIPSGRVRAKTAFLLGFALLAAGIALSAITANTLRVAVVLAVAILLYDAILKHTPLGPLGMGACRFLNILLGLAAVGGDVLTLPNVHLAAATGLYIVGVTGFARTEEAESNRKPLVAAALVMAVALAVAVSVPSHRLAGTTPIYFPYLLAAFGVFVAFKLIPAIRHPSPPNVQAAVKRSILGLVALDAILATAFVGIWGLLILALFLPARWLGKWVYST
jgi:4-hydroxybenzoate polyprenyltransferase